MILTFLLIVLLCTVIGLLVGHAFVGLCVGFALWLLFVLSLARRSL